MNAIDRAMNSELWDAWRSFEADPSVDVAIISGSGQAFCAGADLADYIPNWLDAKIVDVRNNVRTGLGGITRGLQRIYDQCLGVGWRFRAGTCLRHSDCQLCGTIWQLRDLPRLSPR